MPEPIQTQAAPTPPLRLLSPKKEPTKAYDALVVYYELGEGRSLQKVADKLQCSYHNVAKFKRAWWWDERIAAHKADWQTYFDDELRRQAERMATRVLSLRLEILEAQLDAVRELGKRAKAVNALPLVEQEVTHTSPDGKTQHITIKPVGVKAADGARILLAQDHLIRSLTAQTNPPAPKRGAFGENGEPARGLPPPTVEIFVDNGDGTRGKWNELPPPDEYVPGDDGEDDDDEPASPPDGAKPL